VPLKRKNKKEKKAQNKTPFLSYKKNKEKIKRIKQKIS